MKQNKIFARYPKCDAGDKILFLSSNGNLNFCPGVATPEKFYIGNINGEIESISDAIGSVDDIE